MPGGSDLLTHEHLFKIGSVKILGKSCLSFRPAEEDGFAK